MANDIKVVKAVEVEKDDEVGVEPDAEEGGELIVHLYNVLFPNGQATVCVDTRSLADIFRESPLGTIAFRGDPEIQVGQGVFWVSQITGVVEPLSNEYVAELQASEEEESDPEPEQPKKKRWK